MEGDDIVVEVHMGGDRVEEMTYSSSGFRAAVQRDRELVDEDMHSDAIDSRSPRYYNIYSLRHKWAARFTSAVGYRLPPYM